mmetsp:Transcript_16362/g.42176  ORF Transcript_16362/g.42176 Transcript_16362/m.42176 type:complete len:222 (+) Transcript_16362:525-1190(+)
MIRLRSHQPIPSHDPPLLRMGNDAKVLLQVAYGGPSWRLSLNGRKLLDFALQEPDLRRDFMTLTISFISLAGVLPNNLLRHHRSLLRCIGGRPHGGHALDACLERAQAGRHVVLSPAMGCVRVEVELDQLTHQRELAPIYHIRIGLLGLLLRQPLQTTADRLELAAEQVPHITIRVLFEHAQSCRPVNAVDRPRLGSRPPHVSRVVAIGGRRRACCGHEGL